VGLQVVSSLHTAVQKGVTKNGTYETTCQLLLCLKVSKRENFELAFFTLNYPIRVGDLGTEAKMKFFFILVLILMAFGFLPHAESSAKNLL
jgi:hypothetical protein